jgi:hypothetical protein
MRDVEHLSLVRKPIEQNNVDIMGQEETCHNAARINVGDAAQAARHEIVIVTEAGPI